MKTQEIKENSLLDLLPKIERLVAEDVLIGFRRGFMGETIEIEYRTPAQEAFKRSTIKRANPGFTMSFERRDAENGWMGNGHSHITREGILMEVIWREYGQDIPRLLVFCDEHPNLKAEILQHSILLNKIK